MTGSGPPGFQLSANGYRYRVSSTFTGLVGTGARLREHLTAIVESRATVRLIRDRPRRIVLARVPAEPAVDIVVKEFSNEGWKARLDRWARGSDRAERSWEVAEALGAAGIATPAPLFLAVPIDPADRRPSLFGYRYLDNALEVRAITTAINGGRPAPHGLDADRILERVGEVARALHSAGIWHRDLTAGNLLLWPWPDPNPDLYLIDLDRARLRQRPTRALRTRELGRFPIFPTEHRRNFLTGYYGPGEIPPADAILDLIHHMVYRLQKKSRFRSKRFLRRWLEGRTD